MNEICSNKGFTVIELIVVIVLVGIVSAVVLPRFVAPNAFDEIAARDGLIATVRAAQQAALGRNPVTFEINAAGGDWVFVAKSGSNIIRTFEVPSGSVVLETGSPAVSSNTCANDFDTLIDPNSPNFTLLFSEKGDLKTFTKPGGPISVDNSFNGVRICLNDTVQSSVCVSRAGYAYAGNCDG
jgi:prepilin-type N-terminal cleavage/methylation domain-containing protein